MTCMKTLLLGIAFIILVGVGGLVYRNAVEHPSQPIACPLDALVCPDGTAVGRTGSSCTFPACPLPNVLLAEVGISYAIPSGFAEVALPDAASVAAYDASSTASSSAAHLIIRSYTVDASSTPLATIEETAIGGASGAPVPATAFTSSVFGTHRFTVVALERFEGTIDTAYYLARGRDVLRFDAVDTGVLGWTDSALDVSALPAHAAIVKLLATLVGQ
jgi:hypothetical protein